MFESDSDRQGIDGHDDGIEIEKRTRRALKRAATVLHTDGTPIDADDDPSMVAVESGNSGREHTIDVREDRCTCEDHRHRGAECYHLRRAKIALVAGLERHPAEVVEVDEDERDGLFRVAHREMVERTGEGGSVAVSILEDKAQYGDGHIRQTSNPAIRK